MKPAVPMWSSLAEMVGLLLLALGTCAFIKLEFIPEPLLAPGYPFALAAIGVFLGLPKLYFSLRNARQRMQEPRP